MHPMFDAPQFPQHSVPPARCLTEIDRPSSKRGNEAIEPSARGLFAFEHIHRAKYWFKLVEPSRNCPNHVAHFPQPLLVHQRRLFGNSPHQALGSNPGERARWGACSCRAEGCDFCVLRRLILAHQVLSVAEDLAWAITPATFPSRSRSRGLRSASECRFPRKYRITATGRHFQRLQGPLRCLREFYFQQIATPGIESPSLPSTPPSGAFATGAGRLP